MAHEQKEEIMFCTCLAYQLICREFNANQRNWGEERSTDWKGIKIQYSGEFTKNS